MELYHVLNRGVEKRNIFLDNSDRVRFVHNLYAFNDKRAAENTSRLIAEGPMFDLRSRTLGKRETLVDIHGWCLMGNHYHLLLSERTEGSITKFLRKINIGYAKYFNERYSRVGTLFQGRTKRIHIATQAHFLYILHYIHLNPLDFLVGSKGWREQNIENTQKAMAHLDKYRWSSYQDYCGRKNFPSILTTSLFRDVFENYQEELTHYLRDMELQEIKPLTLE